MLPVPICRNCLAHKDQILRVFAVQKLWYELKDMEGFMVCISRENVLQGIPEFTEGKKNPTFFLVFINKIGKSQMPPVSVENALLTLVCWSAV